MRVVSLVPSITETLLAWGVEPVGVTRFCAQPHLLAVGGTKNPDLAAIRRLAPDLVVVDEEENRRDDHDALIDAGLEVHVTAVRSITDVGPTLQALAARVGVPSNIAIGNAVVGADAPGPGAASGADSAERPEPAGSVADSVTAFVPIWRRPWMTLNRDTYGSSLLAAIGVANVFGDHDDRYPTVTLDDVRWRRPDRAILPDEPYEFTDVHAAELVAHLGCDAQVVDGRDLFWWGVRTPAAIGRLRASLGIDEGSRP